MQVASPLLAEESVDAVMPHYNKPQARCGQTPWLYNLGHAADVVNCCSVESGKRGSSAMGVMSAFALVATLLGLAAVVFVIVAR
eukprot:30590-Eustigmatos_ZCMA.PRE.1